jgi:hypothetical protein
LDVIREAAQVSGGPRDGPYAQKTEMFGRDQAPSEARGINRDHYLPYVWVSAIIRNKFLDDRLPRGARAMDVDER